MVFIPAWIVFIMRILVFGVGMLFLVGLGVNWVMVVFFLLGIYVAAMRHSRGR